MRRVARMILAVLTVSIALTASSALPATAAHAGNSDDSLPWKFGEPVTYIGQTHIAADVETVWDLITDFEGYKDWNPFVPEVIGKPEEDAILKVKVRLAGRSTWLKHRVTVVEDQHKFCWEDAGWNSMFVSAHRCRILTESTDGGVLLTQEVVIDGGLIDLTDFLLGKQLRKGVAKETAALKALAEA